MPKESLAMCPVTTKFFPFSRVLLGQPMGLVGADVDIDYGIHPVVVKGLGHRIAAVRARTVDHRGLAQRVPGAP